MKKCQEGTDAKKELIETLDGETYPNPLPEDLIPEIW
jgi:aminobenzoyl-glutamate utilization protein B